MIFLLIIDVPLELQCQAAGLMLFKTFRKPFSRFSISNKSGNFKVQPHLSTIQSETETASSLTNAKGYESKTWEQSGGPVFFCYKIKMTFPRVSSCRTVPVTKMCELLTKGCHPERREFLTFFFCAPLVGVILWTEWKSTIELNMGVFCLPIW